MNTHMDLFTALSYLHNAWALKKADAYTEQLAKLLRNPNVRVEVK
jgi:hypothetical protein